MDSENNRQRKEVPFDLDVFVDDLLILVDRVDETPVGDLLEPTEPTSIGDDLATQIDDIQNSLDNLTELVQTIQSSIEKNESLDAKTGRAKTASYFGGKPADPSWNWLCRQKPQELFDPTSTLALKKSVSSNANDEWHGFAAEQGLSVEEIYSALDSALKFSRSINAKRKGDLGENFGSRPSQQAITAKAAWTQPDRKSGRKKARSILTELIQSSRTSKSGTAAQAQYDLLWLTVECGFALIRSVKGHSLSQDESEEIASRTHLSIVTNLSTYRTESSFDYWVAGIAKNIALQLIDENTKQRDRYKNADIQLKPTMPTTAKISSYVTDRMQTDQAFAQLTRKEQITLTLSGLNLPATEIAEYLNEAPSTTRRRINRSHKKLSIKLER